MAPTTVVGEEQPSLYSQLNPFSGELTLPISIQDQYPTVPSDQQITPPRNLNLTPPREQVIRPEVYPNYIPHYLRGINQAEIEHLPHLAQQFI